MRRLVLLLAIGSTLAITAIAIAAPHSGKWHGRVLVDAPGRSDDGAKLNYGYAPNDHPSVVRFKVAKGGHKLTGFKVTVATCGPPAVPLAIKSVKIKGNGKFAKTVKQALPGLSGDNKATVKLRGKLSGSTGSGKLSIKAGCTDKFKFKLKH
jgi:hypothetical protein